MTYEPLSRSKGKELDILLIENDPATALLTKEAFREAELLERIVCLPNGDDALAYLRREDRYAGQPYPDVIFLDLHLPKMSGLEVLKELKANPKLCVTPVVIVSGSSNPREIQEAYELHAACYVRKPDNLNDFIRFVQICFAFWGTLVTLPEKPDLSAVAK
jgi:chemotaxis family two-component system response regulator Rcp1